MTKREENKYSMYKAVNVVLDKYQSAIDQIPAFVQCENDFKSKLDLISENDTKYKTTLKGAKATKDDAEDELIGVIMKVARPVYVFARRKKDENLKALTRWTDSGLKKLRDTELLQIGKNISNKITENVSELADFGITSAISDDFQATVKAYDDALGGRDSKSTESKTARKDLTDDFYDADDILKEDLDSMIESVKSDHPQFYKEYHAARIIKDM